MKISEPLKGHWWNRRTQRQLLSNLRLPKNETNSLLAAKTSNLFMIRTIPAKPSERPSRNFQAYQHAPKEEESAGVKEIVKELQSIHALPVDDIDHNNNNNEPADGSSSTCCALVRGIKIELT